MTRQRVSLVPIKVFSQLILNDMLQYIQQLKKEVSGNPLIVSRLLEDKCNQHQFTAKYQKEERFLFFLFLNLSFLPFLPLSASH